MIPADTVGTDHGSRTSTSRMPKPRTRWLSRSATSSPITVTSGTATRTKINVVLSELPNSGSSIAFR